MELLKRKLIFRTDGMTAAEYALLAALIALAILATITLLGTSLSDAFDRITSSLA